jgi:hypothetical protein
MAALTESTGVCIEEVKRAMTKLMTAGVPAEFRIQRLATTRQDQYRYTNLLREISISIILWLN